MTDRAERARAFRALHERGTLVLLNAWDAASAALMARTGALALATTSSGVSWSLGVPDGEHLSREQMVAAVARIAAAVDVPVSADAEAGYGPRPADVEETVDALIGAGAVGLNLEDSGGSPRRLLPLDVQCERVGAARRRGDHHGIAFTVNARTDVYLAKQGPADEWFDAAVARGRAFAAAGADCFFVPGVTDGALIGRLVRASPLPVNVLLAPGVGPTIPELRALGVRRVSVGGALARAAYTVAARAAADLLAGDATALSGAIAPGDMQAVMASLPSTPAGSGDGRGPS